MNYTPVNNFPTFLVSGQPVIKQNYLSLEWVGIKDLEDHPVYIYNRIPPVEVETTRFYIGTGKSH